MPFRRQSNIHGKLSQSHAQEPGTRCRAAGSGRWKLERAVADDILRYRIIVRADAGLQRGSRLANIVCCVVESSALCLRGG